MSIIVDGSLTSRSGSLSSMISNYISKKQQTLQSLYQQKAAIEEMYNNVASGLYTTNNTIYQLNNYYNSQILAQNSTINTLQAQIKVTESKISSLNSLHNSFKTTVTSLDDFLESVRNSSSTSSEIDFSNTNESVMDVELKPDKTITTQRIEYNVTQVATATKAISNVLNGYNISKNTLVKDLFAGRYDTSRLTGSRNDLTESMTMKQLGIKEGYFDVGDTTIYISENDTLGDIANRLKQDGYAAGIQNGQFYIDSKNVKSLDIHNRGTNFGEVVGLTVSTGNFSINGKEVVIDDDTTIQDLLDTINNDEAYGVGAVFENNQLTLIANRTGNVLIEIDKGTSNFTNVAGFTLGGKMITDNLVLGSDGSVQMLTGSENISSITGNLSAGEFTITKTFNGTVQKATIQVTPGANLTETLNNVIDQINASSLDITAVIENDRFVIKNNDKGAGYEISVEAGESDFTQKLGFTNPVISTGVSTEGSSYTKLTGITNITDPDNTMISAGSFKINNTTITLAAGSLSDAIDKINTYKNTTGVIAEFNGTNIVLRNEYTGDTNIYVEGGTSNFGEVAGFTTASINTAVATIGQVGSKSTLTGSETVNGNLMIETSVIKINGTEVNIAAGKLSDVISNLNANYSDTLNVTFAIGANNKLVITEQRNGELPITVTDVSGNFAQLTGISGYQMKAGTEEKYGSSKTLYTTTKNVSNNTQILDSTLNLNGHEILVSGTIADAIQTINSYSSTTGVEAFIDNNNKFVLRNVNTGSTGISFSVASGDFGRVVGTGSYTTVGGTTYHSDKQMATVTGANGGLNEFTNVLAGSKIQFGTTIIDLGASVGAALLAINNNKDITGVEAYLNSSGQFVLRATSDEMESIEFKVIGVGDFGRVTGLGSYTVGASESNGEITNASYSKLTGVNNVTSSTEITASNITLSYVNDLGVNVSKTFSLKDGTLEEAMKTINDANWYVKAEIVNNKLQFVSRTTGPFQIGLSVNAIEGVTGDFGRVVGMASSITASGSTSHLSKNPATYVGATSGLNAGDELIGSNTITLWMSRTKANTGSSTAGGSGALASVAQTVTFSDKDGDGKITIQDAIDSINDVKSITKIEALLVNGQFVLRQTDANTAGEGDTINFTLSGDGDFARVAGYGTYTTIGQSNTGTVTGQSFSTLTGSRDVSANNEVLSGSFTLSVKKAASANSAAVDLSVKINIADGTLQNAINSINSQLAAAGIAVSASITDGKLQFKSDIAGDYNISVNMDNSDIGRVVGIGPHTTYDGSTTYVEKTAAKVTGGVTGLTLDSQITGEVQLTLQGLVTRTTTGVNTEGGTNNVASAIKTVTLSGTIGDAIDAINAQTSVTQIKAYLDAQGRFVLEQTNQNTENEFDTISFSVSGTGDFGGITGLSTYISYGQADAGSTTGQKYSYIAGVVDNLKGTEQITAGVATITFTDNTSSWDNPLTTTFNVDISGTVESAAQQITAKAQQLGLSLEAYIDDSTGRLTIKSTSYGPDEISISVIDSDFARITGIANYSMDYGTVTSGQSTYELHPVLTGGNEVTEDINVIGGTLKIGSYTISTVNKTIGQIAEEVNNLKLAGVTADVETGYFRIKMMETDANNPYNIEATGDFARLTGLGSYTVGSATYVDGSYTISDGTPSYVTKSAMGMNLSTTFVGGSITINHNDGYGGTASFTIDTTGKTMQQVIDEINAVGQSGPSINSPDGYSLNYVYASFENEQIVIKTNDTSHTISATGDFARVTGFSEYRSGSATNVGSSTKTETGTLRYQSQNTSVLSDTTTFTDGVLSITFENGSNGTKTISTNAAGKTVAQVVADLQAQANNYYAETSKDGYITSRPYISFNSQTGKIVIETYGESHDISATGNVATLTGFNGDYDFTITPMKDIVTYYKDGTLTGSLDVSTVNGQAIYGQAGTIDFYNGDTKIGSITVDAGDDLNAVLAKINSMVVDYDPPSSSFNIDFDNTIDASIVNGKIQLKYGAGMQDLRVSGTSSFVYFYGLGSTETVLADRSTSTSIKNEKDVYIYSNGSITGSVDVKDMLSTGSLTVGGTNIGPFSGQQNGVLTFVSNVNGQTLAVGNVEILATDTLDDVMNKINNMKAVDAITPDGVEINKIDGFKASFTADGRIQITYGGQQGSVRIQDTSGFAQYYGLTDSSQSWGQNSSTSFEERPYPDEVGKSTVTGSSKGYTENSVVGSLQSGSFSVSLNGKTVVINYTNTESISVIMSRLIEQANQTDGSGLFTYNGELGGNMLPLTEDRLSYTINSDGQLVITGGVESRTGDKLVITDISGNFARLTGIATAPDNYTGGTGTAQPSQTPGIVIDGTDYIVTTYSADGSHGRFTFAGASINGLTGDTALTGIKDGGFYLSTTDGNKWITVNAGDTVNDVLDRINALNASINASFDELNHKITITSTDNALTSITITGDTSGFVQRAGLGTGNVVIDENYTNEKESLGHSKIWGTVDNLHADHILGNIQGGVNGAVESVTISSGSGSVNIAISDDESLNSIIQKIKDTGAYDAGITNGKFWIKSTTDSDQVISVSDSNFARIVGLVGDTELLGNGSLTIGSFGTMNYTGASIAGLQGSSNITIDSSLAGAGDGSFRITLSDKNTDTVNVASKSFDVSITKDMTVDDIMTAIRTAAVNAGVTGFNISFDSSSHQVKISVSGNQAEQITFTGLDAKGTELVNRLGLGTSDVTTTKNGVNTKETDGETRLTGSVKNLHGTHILGNLKSETFTISGANGNVNISVTAGQSLSDIISTINTQSGGKYIANIDAEGRFYIQATNQSSSAVSVSSTDFTRRVGLVASNTTEGANSQTSTGSHGDFIFRGAGGSGGSGIDGMKGTTIFAGLRNGSFNFTLGETSITTPDGKLIYHPRTTYTVNVSSSDSVQTILNKMKQAIIAGGNVDQSAMEFTVEVDDATNKGRVYIKMSGKDASEIVFSNDTSGFITMAGLSNTGATTDPNYTEVDRSYGKSVVVGSMTNLKYSHIFGNMQAGTMIITAGSVSKTINIAATDSIQNVADKISQGGQFEAGLDENGSFYIKTTGENAADITVSGTSDFYKLVGINAGSWSATATHTQGSYGYSKITGSATGLSASQKFNNMTTGDFTISAAGHRTLTVSVTAGVTTIQDVIDFINNSASSDFHAELDSSTGQLVINTEIANGATIQVKDGSSNFAQIVGLTSGTVDNAAISYTGKSDKYSTLTGATTGLDSSSKFSSGDFTISVTNPDGSVTSKTFTLTGTETLSTIAATISNSTLGITAAIDSGTGQLVFTSKVSGAYTISVTDGTSNFAEVTGMTRNNSQIQPSTQGSLATLTSVKTAENASLLGYTSGTFFISLTDDNGNITNTQKITINSTDTVEQIAQKISDSGIGIRAEIDADGRMVLTRTSSLTTGGIVVTKGTSDFTNKIGFTSGGEQSDSAIITSGTDATKAVIKGSVLATADSSMKLGALGINSGTFRINNVIINVSDSETIALFVNKINNAFAVDDPNGVRAEFKDNRIILTANEAADNSRIMIEAGSSNVADVLGFTNGVTLNNAAQEEGLNAIYTLNGKDYESHINTIALDGNGNIVDVDSAEEAIRLTIKAIGSGIIDIGKQSVEDAFNKLAVFASKFNASMSLSHSSALVEDAGFKAFLSAIKSALVNDVGSITKVEKELADIGIVLYSTPTASGSTKISISLNRDKFVDAYINETDKVKDLLIGDDTSDPIDPTVAGSFVRLKAAIDDSLDPISGYFKSNARILDAQKRAMQKELTIAKGELAQLKAELEVQTGDSAAAKNKEELENFLKSIEEQYKTVNDLIYKLNKQYTQSLSVLVMNKNNPSFTG